MTVRLRRVSTSISVVITVRCVSCVAVRSGVTVFHNDYLGRVLETTRAVVLLQVVLVRWNEPYQKLATCDADGGIFVWIQDEGRWSVELVNDRGAQVPSILLLCSLLYVIIF